MSNSNQARALGELIISQATIPSQCNQTLTFHLKDPSFGEKLIGIRPVDFALPARRRVLDARFAESAEGGLRSELGAPNGTKRPLKWFWVRLLIGTWPADSLGPRWLSGAAGW